MRYTDRTIDPVMAARELNAEIVVEGSIQKLGPQLRAQIQVWDARDASPLLSARHDAEMSKLFELQDRLAETLHAALGVSPGAPENPPTQNVQAYELYLRAIERLSLGNPWDTRTGIEMLRNVTRLDPQFVDAWAGLAQGCVAMGFAFEPEGPWLQAADEAIDRALQLDQDNVEARVAKGRVLWSPGKGFQNRAALRVLAEAVRLSPTSHKAVLFRSLILMHVGLLDEARLGLSEALAMQPNDPFTLNFLGQTLEYAGDYDAAEDYQVRALALDPSQIWANLFYPTVLIRKGDLDRAEAAIETAKQILGRDQMLMTSEALLWARRGDGEKAVGQVIVALENETTVAHRHHAFHNAAAVYSLTGRASEAVACLRDATRTGLPNYPVFRDDPHLRPLGTHEPFRELLAGLRCEWEEYRREFVT